MNAYTRNLKFGLLALLFAASVAQASSIDKKSEAQQVREERSAACRANTTASCVYEIAIHEALKNDSVQTVNFYIVKERLDQIDKMIENLIKTQQMDIAQAYIYKEIGFRSVYETITRDSKLYSLLQQTQKIKSEKIQSDIGELEFDKIITSSKGGDYLNENFYDPLKEGNPEKAGANLEALSFEERRGNYDLVVYRDKIPNVCCFFVITPREYLDVLRALTEGYAKQGNFKKASEVAAKLEDQTLMEKVFSDASVPSKSHDATFEFLEGMIGAGAGTDGRTKKMFAFSNVVEAHVKSGKIQEAKDTLRKMRGMAQELQTSSISYAQAMVALAASEAYLKENQAATVIIDTIGKSSDSSKVNPTYMAQIRADASIEAAKGAIYNKDIEQAEKWIETISDPVKRAVGYNILSTAKPKSDYLEKAAKIADDLKYEDEKAEIYLEAARASFAQGNKENAKELLDRAANIYLPVAIKIDVGASISHGRKPRFNPLQDIFDTYITFGYWKEVPDKIELIGERAGDARYNILYKSIKKSIQLDNIEAVEFYLSIINQMRAKDSQPNFENMVDRLKRDGTSDDKIAEIVNNNKQGQLSRSGLQEFDNYIDLAYEAVKGKEDKELVTKFRGLYMAGFKKFKAAHDQSNQKNNVVSIESLSGLTKAKMAIVDSYLADKVEISPETLQDIYLSVKAQGQYDGYSFNRKFLELLEISQLLDSVGFHKDSSESLNNAALMSRRIVSRMTRSMVPMNSKQADVATMKLSDEYTKRGNFNNPFVVGKKLPFWPDRSLQITFEKMQMSIALEAAKHGKFKEGIDAYKKITHPLYKSLSYWTLQDKGAKMAEAAPQVTTLESVLRDAWDDEEVIDAVKYLTRLATVNFQDGRPEIATVQFGLADKITSTFTLANHITEGNILISDAYLASDQTELAKTYMNKATESVKGDQLTQGRLQTEVSKRLNRLSGDTSVNSKEASKPLRDSMVEIFDLFEGSPNWTPEISRVAKMVEVADGLTAFDGKIDNETKSRIIAYLKSLKLPAYDKDARQAVMDAQIEANKHGISSYDKGLKIIGDIEKNR